MIWLTMIEGCDLFKWIIYKIKIKSNYHILLNWEKQSVLNQILICSYMVEKVHGQSVEEKKLHVNINQIK